MSAVDLRKAILVDDDRDISVQSERVLRRCGVVEIVHCRRMATAGARIASGESVDVILVDVDLDEVRGQNVGELLSGGNHSSSHIPVLFIADVHNRSDVACLREAGCFHFLMKPLNDNILEQKIRELAFKGFDPEKEREVVSQIQRTISVGDLGGAENLLKPILRRYPAAPAFQVLLGELFYEKGDYRGAESVVSKTLKIDPDFLPAQRLNDRVREKLVALDVESRERAEAQRLRTLHAEALELNSRALGLVKDNLFSEAIHVYEEALTKTEGFERRHVIFFNAAVAYFRSGNFALAKERCHASLECAPASYEKPGSLLQKIAATEGAPVVANDPAASASGEFIMEGMDPASAAAEEAVSSGLDPEEESRILKFIMFEGKY